MAIERALRLKGQDLNFQAAKAGAEFSQLLSEGNREAAEAKLSEAREFFNLAGEFDLLQAEVLNRLSVLGGDIPLARYNELLGVTENASVIEQTVISTSPKLPAGYSPVLTEAGTLQPTIQSEASEQADKSPVIREDASPKDAPLEIEGVKSHDDENGLPIRSMNESQDIAVYSDASLQADIQIDVAEAGNKESQEEEIVLPTIRINEESHTIIIESGGETTMVPFKKNKRDIQFKLLAYLSEQPGIEIPRETLDEFLKLNRSDTSVGITMYALRRKLGDAEGKIIETVGASRSANYRLNATIEPWETDASLESRDVTKDATHEISKDIFTGNDSIIEAEIAEEVEVIPAGVTATQQKEIQELTSNSETEDAMSHELTSSETYALAQLLSNEDRNALSKHGITVGLEDRPQIREIAEKYVSQIEDLDDSIQRKQREVLLHKLLGYVGNKEEVFMANLANEDALFLLAFMAGVTSEDTMRDLLGYTSDVKKNG